MTDLNEGRPGYKKTKVGWIPKEWGIYTLEKVGSTYSGLSGKTKADFGTGLPFIPYTNIFKNNRIDFLQLAHVQVGASEKQNLVKHGDILFTGSSETPEEVGMSSVVMHEPGILYLNSFCFGFRLHSANIAIPGFTRYLFRGSHFRNLVIQIAQGATRYNLSKSLFLKLPVSLPPLAEQRRIAAVLSTWDDSIETVEKLIDAKERRKKGLMQQLLSGKVRLPGFAENTERKKSRFGSLPADWSSVQVKRIACEITERNGQAHERTVLSCSKYDGLVDSLSYFGKQVYSNDRTNYKVVRQHQFAFPSNHVEEGSIGRLKHRTEGALSPIYVVFELNSQVALPEFYECLFKSSIYQHIFAISTNASVDRRGSLRWSGFKLIEVPLPPLPEQKAIAEVLTAADEELEELRRYAAALRTQKRGLMQQLLSGAVRTTQLPEPADAEQ